MGAEIIKVLDEEGLSTRQAEGRTEVSHSEFSRILHPRQARDSYQRH